MNWSALGLTLVVFSIAGASAQPTQTPATPTLSQAVRQYVTVPEPVVALTNVRVVDGTGRAPMESQTIVIQNGRIASVGPAAQAKVPAGARVMDLAGHTVIPGLIGMGPPIRRSSFTSSRPPKSPRSWAGSWRR